MSTLKTLRQAVRAAIMAFVILLMSTACGSSFDSSGVVMSVHPREVCLTRSGGHAEPVRCFDPAKVDGDDQFVVGDCVSLRMSGEGAEVLRAHVVPCSAAPASSGAIGSAEAALDAPPPGRGVLSIDGRLLEFEVTSCELDPVALESPAFDDLSQLFALEGAGDTGLDGDVFGIEIFRGRGPGTLFTDSIYLWEGARSAPTSAWEAVGGEGSTGATPSVTITGVTSGLLFHIDGPSLAATTTLSRLGVSSAAVVASVAATCPVDTNQPADLGSASTASS